MVRTKGKSKGYLFVEKKNSLYLFFTGSMAHAFFVTKHKAVWFILDGNM